MFYILWLSHNQGIINLVHDEVTDGYHIRRQAVDRHIPLITNVQFTKVLMRALEKYKIGELEINDWGEYRN